MGGDYGLFAETILVTTIILDDAAADAVGDAGMLMPDICALARPLASAAVRINS